MRILIVSLIIACAFATTFVPTTALAADDSEYDTENDNSAARKVFDLPQPVAIQGRRYQMGQSLLATVGYMPTDAFNKGYSLTAAYRYGLTNYLIWEVFSFNYVITKQTQLEQDLLNLNIKVTNVGLGGLLDFPRQIYMTGLLYSPMYSKSLLFNSRLTYSETSLFLGIGTLNFTKVGHKPFLAPGLNARFYISQNWAVNGYFRDYFYLDDHTGITGLMDFGIGIEFKLSDLHSSEEKVQ